jgi:uncharacterized protein (TIGR02246 family)
MMKQVLSTLVFLLLGTTAVAAEESTGNLAEHRASPAAVSDALIDAWNRHDIGAFAAYFAADADFVNVIGVWLRGRGEIRKHHEAIHATRMKDSHLTALETEVRPVRTDVAIVHVRWELTGQTGPSGEALPARQGILSHIITKVGDQWVIASSQNTDITLIPSSPAGR